MNEPDASATAVAVPMPGVQFSATIAPGANPVPCTEGTEPVGPAAGSIVKCGVPVCGTVVVVVVAGAVVEVLGGGHTAIRHETHASSRTNAPGWSSTCAVIKWLPLEAPGGSVALDVAVHDEARRERSR